ncbi:MAG: hypothetical protein M1825_000072 [Sarcosagium campestre]|nr:MAG: hypothetical protein M1825_000072 [Sarcosagium campestre]
MPVREGKSADPSTEKEVDEMILDYLVERAIQTLLAESVVSHANPQADLSLELVDSFLYIFNTKHTSQSLPREIRFRLQLVRFIILYSRRLVRSPTTPSSEALRNLRRQNRARASACLSLYLPTERGPDLVAFTQGLPLSPHRRDRNYYEALDCSPLDRGSESKGIPSSPPLLDTLPLFMTLSAEVSLEMEQSDVTQRWIDLALQFMLHAVLEAYLIDGAKGPSAVEEAYAWGVGPLPVPDDSGQGFDLVYEMLTDDQGAVLEEWVQSRRTSMELLVPESGQSVGDHLESLMRQEPLHDFEESMTEFLQGLASLLPAPALMQLERGAIDGLSQDETQDLKHRIGL